MRLHKYFELIVHLFFSVPVRAYTFRDLHQLYVDHGPANDADQVSDPRCRNIQIIP